SSTLFPYTTLFRSFPACGPVSKGFACDGRRELRRKTDENVIVRLFIRRLYRLVTRQPLLSNLDQLDRGMIARLDARLRIQAATEDEGRENQHGDLLRPAKSQVDRRHMANSGEHTKICVQHRQAVQGG